MEVSEIEEAVVVESSNSNNSNNDNEQGEQLETPLVSFNSMRIITRCYQVL